MEKKEIDENEQVELIRQYKRLDAEIASVEDQGIARKLRKEADAIKSRVIEANLDLVEKMVRSQVESESDIPDVMGITYQRMMQCFHYFDPDKTEINFRIYLGIELKRFLHKKRVRLGINMPVSFHEVCNKINIVYNQLCQEKKRYATKQEVADALKIDISKIESVLRDKENVFSLDQQLSDAFDDGDNCDWHGLISNDLIDDPFNLTSDHELGEIMPKLSEGLLDHERNAMALSFHSPYLCKNTLDRISNEHPAIAKRVKNVEKELLEKGIKQDEIKTFQSFFDCCRNSANNPMPKILKDQGF
jgi:DNA-directed RNA polymerase specialized sigma subunit